MEIDEIQNMVLKTKITHSKNKQGATYIHIPKSIITDSTFPFDLDTDELEIKIDDTRLIIEKLSESE